MLTVFYLLKDTLKPDLPKAAGKLQQSDRPFGARSVRNFGNLYKEEASIAYTSLKHFAVHEDVGCEVF